MLVAGGIGQGYLNRPKVPEHLGFYLDAFWDLNSGEGIPFSELDCYARRYGFDGTDEFDRFKALIKRSGRRVREVPLRENQGSHKGRRG
jgi:hypothetical protein